MRPVKTSAPFFVKTSVPPPMFSSGGKAPATRLQPIKPRSIHTSTPNLNNQLRPTTTAAAAQQQHHHGTINLNQRNLFPQRKRKSIPRTRRPGQILPQQQPAHTHHRPQRSPIPSPRTTPTTTRPPYSKSVWIAKARAGAPHKRARDVVHLDREGQDRFFTLGRHLKQLQGGRRIPNPDANARAVQETSSIPIPNPSRTLGAPTSSI